MATPLLIKHPSDTAYGQYRYGMHKELSSLTEAELKQKLLHEMRQPHPVVEDSQRDMTQKILGEIRTAPTVPDAAKAILDSTSGTTGNVLIRQDLEPILHALYVRRFPAWERLTKKPANGL